MKSLLVFDEHIDLERIRLPSDGGVDLFPFTGNLSLIEKVKKKVKVKASGAVRLLDSAIPIDDEVGSLRSDICRWSADIGETRVFSRTLKEWFLLPRSNASAWWFSLLSEKNTFKTEAFFNIARVNALKRILLSGEYGYCVFSVLDEGLGKAIGKAAKTCGILGLSLPTQEKEFLKYALNRLGILGEFLSGLLIFARFFLQRFMAKQALPPLTEREPDLDSLLFVSYFPAAEPKMAEKGVFKNSYYLALQEKLGGWGRKHAWLLMHLSMSGKRFRWSINLARVFIKNGEKICFLPEFLTLGLFLFCFGIWLRQIALSIILYGFAKNTLHKYPASPECAPILRRSWFKSFCGAPSAECILYYSAFRSVFANLPNITDVVYCMEMHAWEKGLNAAARIERTGARTIGFQHVAISSNYFHFFYDPSETQTSGKPTDLPLPDIMAIAGKLTKSLLSRCGYENIVMVESVRHLYVNKLISDQPKERPEKPVLLVAGSINKIENKALAAFVYHAFPQSESFEIWFKAHPMCPFEAIFEELEIDPSKAGYVFKGGNIADVLAESKAVFVPTSTASIEALSFGCEVVVPVLPDSMLMNPLSDYKDYYHKVTMHEEFKRTVEAILFDGRAKKVSGYKSFIGEYWFTDPELPKWRALLAREPGTLSNQAKRQS